MLSRRDFLKLAGLGTGAAILNACAPVLAPTSHSHGGVGFPTQTSLPSATPEATHTPLPAPTSGPTPASRRLCFVLWDHQLAMYDFKPRNLDNPVPETVPLYSGDLNPLTSDWVAYWQGLLHLCNPDMDPVRFEHAWESLVADNRAFTNQTGPLSGNFALHSLTCGGATHEMVTGVPVRGHMEIYTLNSRRYPPALPSKATDIDMTRHFFATTGSNVKLPDGSYAVYGFPQFENCIVPLMSRDDTDMIDVARIRPVTSIQRPYNP